MGVKNVPITNSSYSELETDRILRILDYFCDFLEHQQYYEFFYSQKRGVFFSFTPQDSLRSEEDGLVLSSDQLFQFLVEEICNVIKSPRLAVQIGGDEGILPLELAEARRQVDTILGTMDEEDRLHYGLLAKQTLNRIKDLRIL